MTFILPNSPVRLIAPLAAAAALLAGCAATINQEGMERRTTQAIGRSAGQFTISERSEEAGGRINYTVNTRDGAHYRCYLVAATGLQKAMTFGQMSNSDAICAAMVGGRSGSGSQGPAAPGTSSPAAGGGGDCNALLRAAGRCRSVNPEAKSP